MGVKPEVLRMGIAISGSVLVGVGSYMHYAPLGFIVPGAMLFTVALVGTLRARG